MLPSEEIAWCSLLAVWLLWRSDHAKLQRVRLELQRTEAALAKLHKDIEDCLEAEAQRLAVEAELCRVSAALQQLGDPWDCT